MSTDPRPRRRRRRRVRGFGYLRRLGPGLVTGASDDDPSGIGTYSQVGASMRFRLLWTALISLPLAAAVQETAARLGLATGKGLAALIRERFRRPVLYVAVSLVICANVFNIGADLGSMAAAVQLVIPIPFVPLLVGMTVVTVTLEVLIPYHRYAKVLRWLTASLLAYIVVLFVVKVDWRAAVRGTLLPSFSGSRTEIAALIAIFGTTISPYLFFWQASEEVEEAADSDQEVSDVGPRQIRAMRVDVIAGMSSAVVVMFAIMVSSAATLGSHGVATVQTADQAARALEPIAGRLAGLLFALGIVGTGALAIPVLAGSTAYAIAETGGWKEGLGRKLKDARGFYAIIAGSMVLGLGLNFVGLDPIRALYFSAVLNGLAAPPLILLMLILSNDRTMCGPHTGNRISNVLLVIAFLLMAGLPVAYLLS